MLNNVLQYTEQMLLEAHDHKRWPRTFKLACFQLSKEAVSETNANTSVIFVPARFAKVAIIEAAENGVELIICITEGVPVLDRSDVIDVSNHNPNVRLIGPNCPRL